MANTDISLEPLLNSGNLGEGAKVTAISEIGACSNRDPITINDIAQALTIGANKNSIEIQNTGSKNIYYGGSGVTSAKGLIIFPDDKKIFNKVKPTFSVYLICATGETCECRIAEYL